MRGSKWHQFWCHLAPNWRRKPQQKIRWLQSGSISEPRAGQTWKWLRIGAKIKYFREKRIKIGFSRDLPLEGGENNFPISDKKVSKEYWGRKIRSRYNFWSLSVRTSEKKIKISFNPQFWVFLAAYPLRRFFRQGVNFWRFSLPTKWRDKYSSWIGLVLDLPDAYQMGEKFSKPFIKIEFSCSTSWKEKLFFENP